MTGGFKMSAGRASLLAAAGFLLVGGASAQAADLGGNCCADLEERIAELEATTARKGNRKVSLEISGHVNEAVMWWDDGFEENAYVVTNDNARTRFRFKGSAKISDDWKAGYLLEIGVRGANSKRFTQDDPTGGSDNTGLDLRHSAWYIESKKLGRVWMGRTGPAAEGITEINLAHTKDVAKLADVEDTGLGLGVRFANGEIGLRNNGEIFSYRRLINHSGDQPGETERGQIVRYDTPEIAGFTATAAWGGDDYWDIGLRYAGEFGGFKVAGGIAYGEETSANSEANIIDDCLDTVNGTAECRQVGGSLSVMHEASGIYVTGAAGWREDELIEANFSSAAPADPDSTFWAIEVGIEKKWIPLGKTTLFGQYYDFDGGSNDRTRLSFDGNAANSFRIQSSDLEMWGGGVVQSLDAASMLLYAYYRHYESDVGLVDAAGAAIAHPGIEDVDIVVGGAMIKF